MGTVQAAFAEWERELIGARTREGMAQRKAEGVQMGRPSTMPTTVVDRITAARAAGQTWQQIATALNDDGVPTAHGGKAWWPGTVRKVALLAERARTAVTGSAQPR
jgi:DNA invertase Pin-like site-specific DNA recombinase